MGEDNDNPIATTEVKGVKTNNHEDKPNIKVQPSKVSGNKCQRCWKFDDKLFNDEICKRCNEAINLVSE